MSIFFNNQYWQSVTDSSINPFHRCPVNHMYVSTDDNLIYNCTANLCINTLTGSKFTHCILSTYGKYVLIP